MKLSFHARAFCLLSLFIILFPLAISAQTTQKETLVVGDVVCIESNTTEGTYMADTNNDATMDATTTLGKNAWWLVTSQGLQNVATGQYVVCQIIESGTFFKSYDVSYILSTDAGTPISITGSKWYIGSYTSFFNTTYCRPNYSEGKWAGKKISDNTSSAYLRDNHKINFEHYKGIANVALSGTGRQRTHYIWETIYANTDETKALKSQVADFETGGKSGYHYLCGYYRWYDYDTDGDNNISSLSHSGERANNYTATSNNRGKYVTLDIEPGLTYYSGATDVRIGCDVSQYSDYVVKYDYTSNTTTFYEPTLSYRTVFDIRPATEMAVLLDACTSTPLETYDIVADAGATIYIGPKYQWYGEDSQVVNYYVGASNPAIVKGCTLTNTTTSTSVDLSNVLNNRLVQITAPTSGTAVYQLKDGTGHIIAQFNISVNNTQVEVADLGTSDFEEEYELASSIDFGSGSDPMSPTPLDWGYTTYGFTYSQLASYVSHNRSREDGFCDYSEYALIKSTSGRSYRLDEALNTNISSSDGGYFMFVNANEVPGKVAELDVKEYLCDNAKLLVAVDLVNAAGESDDNDANLNIVIIGVDVENEGQENEVETTEEIVTYTTGDITSFEWKTYLFEMTIPRKYTKYRVRIDNNKATAEGNSFAIDNIRIYKAQPEVVNTQIMTACPTFDVSNPHKKESQISVLRVDFKQALQSASISTYGTQKLSYTWFKSDILKYKDSELTLNQLGQLVAPLSYFGSDQPYFGLIDVNSNWNAQTSGIPIKSFDEYDFSTLTDDEDADYFFANEPKDGDDNYIVLYIIHKSQSFEANKSYLGLTKFGDIDFTHLSDDLSECASSVIFDVTPRSRIVLDDKEYSTNVMQNLAIGEYPLSVKSFGMLDGKIVGYNSASDWILVGNDMTDAEKWGYANALIQFRKSYPNGTRNDLKNKFPGLYALEDKLILDQTEISAKISERGEPLSFVAVPIPRTNADGFAPCALPLDIVLRAEVSAILANPADKESYAEMPPAVQGSACVIRVPEGTTTFPEMDIDFFNTELFKNLTSAELTTLGEMVLCSTDDDDLASTKHTTIYFTLKSKAGKNLKNLTENDIVTLTPKTTLNFKAGKHYGFHSKLMKVEGLTITPAFNFDIYVVPETVVWDPKYQNSAWHNDDNWKTVEGNPAFIPLAETNVIISGDAKIMPVLPLNPTSALGAGANQYLKYDVGVDFNSCNNIYFEGGAELGNQHKLTYKKAYVDVRFDKSGKSNWEMMSFPLRNVVRGDLYVPKAGDGAFDFASASVKAVDNRAYNAFYLKAYSSNITQTVISDGKVSTQNYTYGSASWSDATSALNFKLETARGYAVSRQTTTSQDFVRLPKTATEYYLFYDMGGGNELELKQDWAKYGGISRTEAYKLVYDASTYTKTYSFTNKVGNIFLIGNPFMVNMNVKKFFEVNGLSSNKFYYEYVDGSLEAKLITPTNQELRPLHAIFVKGTSTSMSFKFTPEMMLFNESAEFEEVPNRAPVLRIEEEVSTEPILTLTAELCGARSRAYIAEEYGSLQAYEPQEDAELLTLDAELTPISLYSVASGTALAYNVVNEIVDVPISILVLDSTRIAEIFSLTFEGVDNFDSQFYLYDSLYNTELPLLEGLTLNLELPESGETRYYITCENTNNGAATGVSDLSDERICAVSGRGCVDLYSSDIITSIQAFDVAGRIVYGNSNVNSSQYSFALPAGVYMIQVTLDSYLTTYKVIVK